MSSDQTQRKAWEFFSKYLLSQETFTKDDLKDATGWKEISTLKTYWSKQYKPFVIEVATKDELSTDFDIVDRQIDYYVNIMRWIGLVTVEMGNIHLTATGRRIADLSHAERIYELAQIIFGEPIFHEALRSGTNGVNKDLFLRWKCSGSTIERRLQTVAAWIRYFKTFEQDKLF
jgi:hypothetical protein